MAKAALCRDIPSTLGIPACKQLPSGPCSMASQAVRRRRHTTLVTHGPRKLSALVTFRVFSKTDGLEAFRNCRYLVCRRRNFLLHGGCYGEEAGSGKWTYLAQAQRASKTICDVREGSRCVPRYQGDLASHRASIAGGFVDGWSGDHHLVARLSAPAGGPILRLERLRDCIRQRGPGSHEPAKAGAHGRPSAWRVDLHDRRRDHDSRAGPDRQSTLPRGINRRVAP